MNLACSPSRFPARGCEARAALGPAGSGCCRRSGLQEKVLSLARGCFGMAWVALGNQETAAEGDQAHGMRVAGHCRCGTGRRLVIHPREGGPSGRSSRPSACEADGGRDVSEAGDILHRRSWEPADAPGRPRLPVRAGVAGDCPPNGRRIRLLEAPVQVTSRDGPDGERLGGALRVLGPRLRRPWRCALRCPGATSAELPGARGDGSGPPPAGSKASEWRRRGSPQPARPPARQ